MSNQKEVNISKSTITNRCDLKCSYNFHYPDCNTTAKNNGSSISLTYENGNKPPVIFNNLKYTVHKIDLFAPSLHLFNGRKVAGELIVTHVPELGGPDLIVCVPMIQSGDATSATDLITQVITNVANNAPRKGESTNLNISNFSLQHIIPKKPFIFYTGTFHNTTVDFIVFPIIAPIPLTQSTLAKLTSIVASLPITLKASSGLFFNIKGPNSGIKFRNDDIYISCKPTGASEEQSYVTQPSTSTSSSSSTNLFDSPAFMDFFKILMICLLFIIFFLGLNYAFNALTQLNLKLPGMGTKKS
jgi:carbonic anhydrase